MKKIPVSLFIAPCLFSMAVYANTTLSNDTKNIIPASKLIANNNKTTYDLNDIYQLAIKNNATFLSAAQTYKASQQNIPIAIGMLLPSATISYNGSYSADLGNNGTQNAANTVSLTANQVLFDWSAWSVYTQAQYQAKADSINYAIAQQSLILETSSNYLSVLQAQENLAYAQANLLWNKQLYDQTTQQYQAGLTTSADVQSSKAQYQTAVASQAQEKSYLITAFSKIDQLVGMPIEQIGMLKDDFPFLLPAPNDVNYWIDTANKENLNIVYAQYINDVTKKNIGISLGSFLPSASVSASVSYAAQNDIESKTNSDKSSTSVGLGANWNVINGGSDYATYKQNQYNADAANYSLEQTIRVTKSDVVTLFNQVVTDIDTVSAYKEGVTAAAAAVEDMTSGYNAGTQTIVDLLQQQKLLYQAQENYANAKFKYINDLLLLKQANGSLSYHDLDNINQWLDKSKVIKA